MNSLERQDDFATRRRHLQALTDEELHAWFWSLTKKIVKPLIEETRTNTTPSIERSVLLRMGFSSVESKQLVEQMNLRQLLGHGVGRLVLKLAENKGITVRQAGDGLLKGLYWEELGE